MLIASLVILAVPLISKRLSNFLCAKKCVSGSSFDLKYSNNGFNDHLVWPQNKSKFNVNAVYTLLL